MNKLHSAIAMVFIVGMALLGADRIRNSGPDREILRQIKALRDAQRAETACDHHVRQTCVDEALAAEEIPAWYTQRLEIDASAPRRSRLSRAH